MRREGRSVLTPAYPPNIFLRPFGRLVGEWLAETEDTAVGFQSPLLTGRSGLSVLRTHAGLSRSPPAVAKVGDVLRHARVKSAVSVREIFIPRSSFAPEAALILPRTFLLGGAPYEMSVASVGSLVSLPIFSVACCGFRH
jgi:hypothetical protein